ncbi:MAG: ABC transporter permease, partial [Delftia sp.]|nr:ABC transporter permease [Delftia sp.]
MTHLPFIIKRARRHWQILLTLCLGVLMATALLASGPLLVDTVIEFGLRHTLLNSEPLQGHLRVSTRLQANQLVYDQTNSQAQALLTEQFDAKLERVVQSVGSTWMFPWVGGQLLAEQRVNLHFYDDVEKHVEFIAGGWPNTLPQADAIPVVISDNSIPVVIGDEMARAYALRVGDRVPLSFKRQGQAPDVWIEIAGVARPQNPRSSYWFGEFSPLNSQRTDRWDEQFHALVSYQAFFSVVPSLFPESKINVAWLALMQPANIKTKDISSTRAQIADLGVQLRQLETRITLETELDGVLASYQEQAQTIRAPLYILLAQVVLLVLYYVTMVAALSVQQVQREFAILRSRGASSRQIIEIQLTEAGMIGAVALLSGPVFGLALVRLLVWFGPLADVSQPGWALNFSQSAWVAALAGAAACLGGLLLPIGPALRSSIVTHQQTASRSARPPWWQRSFLDVFVLLGGLVLLWRLRMYDSLVGGAGRLQVDWRLLMAPLALLLGTAAILLRVFPLILGGLAAVASRARGRAGALARWQAARNPT